MSVLLVALIHVFGGNWYIWSFFYSLQILIAFVSKVLWWFEARHLSLGSEANFDFGQLQHVSLLLEKQLQPGQSACMVVDCV